MKIFHRWGYSLMEIMLVVIVIGILAGISVPRMLAIVERSRGAEAREILYKAYAGYQRYVDDNTSTLPAADNNKWSRLGMGNPNSLSGRFFNYTFSPGSSANPTTVTATRQGIAANQISINLLTGAVTNTSPY
ncbi:type IV pilin protein [Candidatus Velamenicoccus archaeovorus]|nr:hypothetical protein [Candidatus Velamenicoccus archaeovorus]